ncbi:P-loop containing nucleoside triphosphate hydrolase protein [Phaeosphaeria sp. MPI-PUGE-AT-0046c]|nr:P-loop containing nucleoside triphosphate hydrolase protein [Phaeosphaeria sp. MPI-PUGE-AT-0046c]
MPGGRRNRQKNSGRRGARSSAGWGREPASSSNVFAALSSTEHCDGEVNAHLSERFGRMTMNNNSSVPHDSIPSSGPSRANKDIREYFELAKKPVAAGPWIDKPEVPSPSEILAPEQSTFTASDSQGLIDVGESLRPHRADGPYPNNEEYLGTKYELLREDTIRPLREAIQEVRQSPYLDESEYSNKSIGIYEPVYITSIIPSPRGLATRVAFSLSRVKKHIRWTQSKRLITGSLVALSPVNDAFQSICILATVAARPVSGALDQNPPQIDLFFARHEDQQIDSMQKFVMVECRSSFFEASRHTMLALQHLMREPFPMAEHLVRVKKEVEPPTYIQHDPYVNLSSLVSMEESANFENVDVLKEWPDSSSLSLDRSQSRAIQRMLTNKLAVVQGPPGTGKTYVSVAMIKVQRDNLRREDSPIIITAQTNHAVDQILRHTMEFEPNFIRLGGRSKDPQIKKRTLYEVRQSIPPQKQPGSQKIQATIAMRKLSTRIQMLLAPLEANQAPLDHRVLLKLDLITREQANSLEIDARSTMGISAVENPGILMEQWLGRCLIPCQRPSQPDDFSLGYEEEEEDFEVEQLQELEAEAVARDDDDDREALRGEVILLSDDYIGRRSSTLTTPEIRELLRTTADLTTIAPIDRGAFYNYFKREVKAAIALEIRKLAKEYDETVLQRKVGLWEEDVRILSEQRIIGCTTTGLSKYRALISALRPRIILVEEAAETMEAPVTAGCFPSLEHLILVGDHQQLRPHTQVHAFEDEPYYLNLSLFERLVRNDVAYSTLTKQRRMIPEVRRLLAPIYGDTLKDHPSVKDMANRPPVEGMGGINSFFFCHDSPEARDGNTSCFNQHEAKMILGFVDYLVLNGLKASKITLLTFYNGQRKRLIRELRSHQNAQALLGVVVVTVDGYQGEENDIVILSLVRSNRNHAIGFLSSDNRACVALSRAKRGFYIFGNAELLACESRVWGCVVEIMFRDSKNAIQTGQKRRVGYNLPLECKNHGRKVWIEDPDDWEHIHGGCDLDCAGILPCQHKCPYRCHPFEHERVNCKMQCNRSLVCGHKCVDLCSDHCSCDICDRRGDGARAMLRPMSNGASFRPSPMPVIHAIGAPLQGAAGLTSIPASSGNHDNWREYVDGGGAAADDARHLQLVKEQQAKYSVARRSATPSTTVEADSARLIEVSPEKKPVSQNANLLIDLDFGVVTVAEPRRQSYANAVCATGKATTNLTTNLLD